jgi:3-oxoacyl-[acyl-carrier protein] reductase
LALPLQSNLPSKEIVSAAILGLNTVTIDILVSNAAQTDWSQLRHFAAVDLDNFQTIFTGNIFSVLSNTLAVLPHLPTSGGGRIINISSADGEESSSEPTVMYGASKAALNHLSRSLAKRYSKEKKCTINSVSVGPTETETLRSVYSTIRYLWRSSKC